MSFRSENRWPKVSSPLMIHRHLLIGAFLSTARSGRNKEKVRRTVQEIPSWRGLRCSSLNMMGQYITD